MLHWNYGRKWMRRNQLCNTHTQKTIHTWLTFLTPLDCVLYVIRVNETTWRRYRIVCSFKNLIWTVSKKKQKKILATNCKHSPLKSLPVFMYKPSNFRRLGERQSSQIKEPSWMILALASRAVWAWHCQGVILKWAWEWPWQVWVRAVWCQATV